MIHTPESIDINDINNREIYLRWCKDIAIKYIKDESIKDSIKNGIIAFCQVIEIAEITKEIANNPSLRAAIYKKFENTDKAIEFIEGWNYNSSKDRIGIY